MLSDIVYMNENLSGALQIRLSRGTTFQSSKSPFENNFTPSEGLKRDQVFTGI